MGKKKGPLDMIALLLGMDYISDLRNPVYLPAVRCVLNFMDTERFGAEEWSEAANYILGTQKEYATAKEAVAELLGKETNDGLVNWGKTLKNYVWNDYMERILEV